mmetsp:Transcript_2361/g.4535  ORF Transcript_2361/g.4535 Transcript_2361/m.4535 type:complete len:339 (-) Transcript_2361:990-2006(-)
MSDSNAAADLAANAAAIASADATAEAMDAGVLDGVVDASHVDAGTRETVNMGVIGSLEDQKHPAQAIRMSPEELHQRKETAVMFLLFIVLFQTALCLFSTRYPKRFREVTLVLLGLYPVLVIFRHQDVAAVIFFSIWLFWSLRTAQVCRLALERPLQAKTPELVYQWFLKTHTVCYVLGMGSLYCFILVPGPALLLLFFALYFGVLGRDCCEICAERISSTVGFSKYDEPPTNLCALCGDELRPMLDIMSGTVEEEKAAASVIKLGCSHEFHATCIRGWCIVGKKQTCPFCLEKVDLKGIVPDLPWNSRRISVLWVQLLTLIRFLVVCKYALSPQVRR